MPATSVKPALGTIPLELGSKIQKSPYLSVAILISSSPVSVSAGAPHALRPDRHPGQRAVSPAEVTVTVTVVVVVVRRRRDASMECY